LKNEICSEGEYGEAGGGWKPAEARNGSAENRQDAIGWNEAKQRFALIYQRTARSFWMCSLVNTADLHFRAVHLDMCRS
jgi:hypothetical protein